MTGPFDIILPAAFLHVSAVAYIVDGRRKIELCRDFVSYALFISFPHLVAGPIQCLAHLLPQTSSRCYAPGRVFDGLMPIVTGLFQVRDCGQLRAAGQRGFRASSTQHRHGPPRHVRVCWSDLR